MKQSEFEKKHELVWNELDQLLAEDGLKKSFKLDIGQANAIKDLPALYQEISHHLAIAKHRRYSASLIARLNQLVNEAHRHFYGTLPNLKGNFIYYAFAGFPIMLRKNAVFFWTACALFFLPGFLFFFLCANQEELIYSLMSVDQVSNFESMYEPGEHIGRSEERRSDTDLAMFSFYIMNNIGISFQTFASGILFGLGSLFFLCFNGIYIGAAAGHISRIGYEETFFPFVIGHGAFELTAIAIAGAAGLKLGWALISPGIHSRSVALRLAAKEAIVIVYGSTSMLVIAAFLEAFWSSSSAVSSTIKYAVGTVFWLLVIYYLAMAGRNHRAA
jgi:uncharacterized membrane protein SpoIIM required for sporulation